nr:homeobox protein caupolican; partial [Biomphalaria glabrata]
MLPPASSSSSSPTMSSPCCENGRSLVNPHTGQTVCSCQYPAGLLTYSRVGLADPVYSTPSYPTAQAYMPLGTDPSAFYPSLVRTNTFYIVVH